MNVPNLSETIEILSFRLGSEAWECPRARWVSDGGFVNPPYGRGELGSGLVGRLLLVIGVVVGEASLAAGLFGLGFVPGQGVAGAGLSDFHVEVGQRLAGLLRIDAELLGAFLLDLELCHDHVEDLVEEAPRFLHATSTLAVF